MSVQLAARRRQVAPPAFTDTDRISAIGHRTDEWKRRCNLQLFGAASCTSGIFTMIGYRLSGTVDARKCRCNLPPGGGKLHLRHLTMIGYRLSGIVDARFLERKDTITAEGLLRNEEY